MDIIHTILQSIVVLCCVVMVYLYVWVGPRIKRISKVQRHIIDMVFAHPQWQLVHHMCNRPSKWLEYTFRRIDLNTFLTKDEIDVLLTGGDARFLSRPKAARR